MLAIRKAGVEDVPVLLRMLHESAEDQGFPNEVVVTQADLEEDGFGPAPRFHTIIAEWNGAPAGMALYFFIYSTWVSRYGLYLEDIYVDRDYRHKGVGKAIMGHLARIALDNGCGRFQWLVHCRNEKCSQAVQLARSRNCQRMGIDGHQRG